MDVDVSIKQMKRILIGLALNKYQEVLAERKDLVKGLYGDHCTLGLGKGFPWNISRLGPRWKLPMYWEILSADRSGATTFIRSCGSSW